MMKGQIASARARLSVVFCRSVGQLTSSGPGAGRARYILCVAREMTHCAAVLAETWFSKTAKAQGPGDPSQVVLRTQMIASSIASSCASKTATCSDNASLRKFFGGLSTSAKAFLNSFQLWPNCNVPFSTSQSLVPNLYVNAFGDCVSGIMPSRAINILILVIIFLHSSRLSKSASAGR